MSTKIYSGFRMETDSLAEAARIIEKFRPWIQAQADIVLDTFMANMAASGASDEEASSTWDKLRLQARRTGERISHVDTDCSIVLIPAHGHILGMFYSAHSAWYQAWCQHEGVHEYSYWNNSDAPDDMPEQEWDARKRAWEFLSPDPVAMQGFAIELMSPYGPTPKAWR